MNGNNIRKVYACPSVPKNSCNWEGSPVNILKHLQKAHGNMVLESNEFSVNVLCNRDENKIMPSRKGLFLIQIKTLNKQMKVQLKLRFLPFKYLNIEEIRYNLEVSSGAFGFSNENYDVEYNPVCNTTSGIEVDVGAIQLIVGHGLSTLLLKVNVYENIRQLIRLPSKTDDDNNTCSEHLTDHVYYNYDNSPDENEDTQTSLTQETFSLYSYELENTEKVCENYYTTDMLQCTNCQCTMIPPIHICPNDHNVCYTCRLGACSVCHRDITEVRNMGLEDYSKTLKHPCRYEPQGCTEVCNYNEIRKHELQCSCCIYKCELCNFEGKLHDIGTHFRIVHPSTKIYDTMSGIHFRKGSNFIIMNNLGVFYCTSSATDFHIEWEVIYCGPKERVFSCNVKITGKKSNQQLKHYFLKRDDNVYKWRVTWDELKNSNVKEKYATLNISCY